MSKSNRPNKPVFFNMVFTAMLVALIMLMTFSGIGYIPIGPLKLTVLTLPVAVGAVLLGPVYGAVLGFVFGLSSFLTCVFGMDALGAVLLSRNPFGIFIVCVLPRILCGLLPAYIFKLISKLDKTKIVGSAVSCTLTALLNTAGFLSLLWLVFANDFLNNADVIEVLGNTVIDNITTLFVLFAGTNAIIEAVVGLVLGTAICKALFVATKKLN